jgi:hypothetical protein
MFPLLARRVRSRALAATFLLALVPSLGGALAASPTASAAHLAPAVRFAADSPSTATARQIAVAHWGVDPCGGNVAITWTAQARDLNAVAHWSSPVPDTGPAGHLDCSIAFNSAASFSWPKFCTVVVHEYGHLVGHGHSADPTDVMAAVYRKPLAACVHARR